MSSLRILALTAIIAATALVHYSSAAETAASIKCYVCAETTANKDCGFPFKAPSGTADSANGTSEEAGEIFIKTDCKFCVVNKITKKDEKDSTYTRSCSTAEVTGGCASANDITTCTSSCDKDLCNVGDDAPSLRLALTTIISALLLSLLAKF
jgi:hypothetical protein